MTDFKISSTVSNDWLLKRFILSATFYFAKGLPERKRLKHLLSQVELSNMEDARKALDIHPQPWAYFEKKVMEEGGVIRQYNDLNAYYSECRTREFSAYSAETKPHLAPMYAQEILIKIIDTGDLDDTPVPASAPNGKGTSLTIKIEGYEGKSEKRIEMAHMALGALTTRLAAGLNVYLVGPAGSGKTFGAEQAAETLGLEFGMMSVGPQTTKSDIFGFMSASGSYVKTIFRDRFENGGIFLFDEIDAAHAGVLTSINAALAGTVCAFPDGMVKKHKNFYCVAAGNTFGTGPDRVYVGRQELDGASLDRFNFVEWNYDEKLEREIVMGIGADDKKTSLWLDKVFAFRHAVDELGIRHIVSPRASIAGIKLLDAGVAYKEVFATTVYKNLAPDQIKRILSHIKAKAEA